MRPIVSCVSIVLNEEQILGDMLDSVLPYVEQGLLGEMIVIDGGSIDNTVQVCLERGVTVIRHPFGLHFGNQRNFAITQTHYPWVLMIDADEIFEPEFWSLLPHLVVQDTYDAYKIPRKNYIDGVLDERAYPDYQLRLFRRYCRWIYPVHEELVGWKNAKELKDVHILHFKTFARFRERNEHLYPLVRRVWNSELLYKEEK